MSQHYKTTYVDQSKESLGTTAFLNYTRKRAQTPNDNKHNTVKPEKSAYDAYIENKRWSVRTYKQNMITRHENILAGKMGQYAPNNDVYD